MYRRARCAPAFTLSHAPVSSSEGARPACSRRVIPGHAVARRVRALSPRVALCSTSAAVTRYTVQSEMSAPSDDVAAALARVDDAAAQHDADAITRELAALPGSELVVLRCCEALSKTLEPRQHPPTRCSLCWRRCDATRTARRWSRLLGMP